MDGAELLERLRARDERAFARLVRAWSPAMLRVVRMYVSDKAAAEEVVQVTGSIAPEDLSPAAQRDLVAVFHAWAADG